MTNAGTAYPLLRESLDESHAELNDEALDELVARVYGEGLTAEDVEGFFQDLGRSFSSAGRAVGDFAQKAAPIVARTLPSIAQGAMAGSAGGPIGAIVGAAAGGVGGALSQTRNPTLRGIGGAIGGATQLASNFTGGGALGNLAKAGLGALGGSRGGNILGGLASAGRSGGFGGALSQAAQLLPQLAGRAGAGAGLQGVLGQAARFAPQLSGGSANALLGMLSRPETLQALTSSALGPLGRRNVMVGNQPVGVQSMLGALGALAGRAAGESAAGEGEALPEYFYGEGGELLVDPADSDQRTDALLTLLALTAPRWSGPPAAAREPEYTLEHQLADEMLMELEMWEAEEAA